MTYDGWFAVVCDLVKFFEGGLTFEYAFKLDFDKLYKINAEAFKIAQKIKDGK